MTIRRQWLIILTITSVLAVLINSLILNSLTNQYFLSYNSETYNYHVNQIKQIAVNALSDDSYTRQQLSVQLESHLDDPIISIKLYDANGDLIASAQNVSGSGYGMMNGMMSRMMHASSEEVDSFDISVGGAVTGVLHIIRYSSLSQSVVATRFRYALIRNSLLSFLIVLSVLSLIGIFVSKKLGRDLTDTSMLAMRIDMGEQPHYEPSRIREIRIIQNSLEELQNRLKIKQKGRKRVIDEFVHQTRTPLSILKMHLEGLGDGIITISGEEIKVCQTQIDDLSAIISNMSMLLDADRPLQTVKAEQFDLHILLQQIINGMKVAYENKKINLHMITSDKAVITTDKYKLSQSIYNLLANAYKFTAPNGKVMVHYELTDTVVSIYIRDSGTGIAKEDIPRLFEAYYRGKNAEKVSGDGLGLYVVKENLEQVGGTIAGHSDPGLGSEFIITIPVQCPADC